MIQLISFPNLIAKQNSENNFERRCILINFICIPYIGVSDQIIELLPVFPIIISLLPANSCGQCSLANIANVTGTGFSDCDFFGRAFFPASSSKCCATFSS